MKVGQASAYLQVAIHDANTHVECFLQEVEPCMDLDQPVHQNGPHLPVELCSIKVEGTHALLQLLRENVNFDVGQVFQLGARPLVTSCHWTSTRCHLPPVHSCLQPEQEGLFSQNATWNAFGWGEREKAGSKG